MAVLPNIELDPMLLVLMVLAGGGLLFSFILWDKQNRIRKYADIVNIMLACRNKPMGVVVDRSGLMIPFVCEPDIKNKGLVKHAYTLINPDLVKPSARAKFKNGCETLFYPLPGYYPIGIHNSAALCQLAKKIRMDDRFAWIPSELTVLALIFNGSSTLYEDAKTAVESVLHFGNEIPEAYLPPIPSPAEIFPEETEGLNEEEYNEEEEEEDYDFGG